MVRLIHYASSVEEDSGVDGRVAGVHAVKVLILASAACARLRKVAVVHHPNGRDAWN